MRHRECNSFQSTEKIIIHSSVRISKTDLWNKHDLCNIERDSYTYLQSYDVQQNTLNLYYKQKPFISQLTYILRTKTSQVQVNTEIKL